MKQGIMGRFKVWFRREDGAGEMVQLGKALVAKLRGWGDGLAPKSTSCSFRGSEISTQDASGLTHNHL